MRGRLVLAAVAVAVLGGTGVAVADPLPVDPVQQSKSGSSYQMVCLHWYDSVGVEQGSIQLCGWEESNSYGDYQYQYRYVQAERRNRTCDANGQECTDGYTEVYNGPADASEFSMDIVAGTATFNLVLAGETAADDCRVQATATASDTYTYNNPYPYIGVYGNPSYPYVQVTQGPVTRSVQAAPTYGYAGLSERNNESVHRSASGSGTVCSWTETSSTSDGGSMSSYDNTTTYTSVYAGYLPVPYVPLP